LLLNQLSFFRAARWRRDIIFSKADCNWSAALGPFWGDRNTKMRFSQLFHEGLPHFRTSFFQELGAD
jgi:hypothetical protein